MKILNQKDPTWANQAIGQTNLKLKDYGCLIVSLSMLSSWYGIYQSPAYLSRNLKFTDKGLLIWKSIDSVMPMKFVYRYYKKDDCKIKTILMSKDEACVLQVNSSHWVVLIGYSEILGYKIADPIDGKKKYIPNNYKITGFSELTRKN